MTDEHTMKLTDFDYLTGDHHLQMIKAALPYVSVPQQRVLSLLVKIQELRRTMSLFEEQEVAAMGISALPETQRGSTLDMMKAIKPYGNPQEQDFIEMFCNFIQGIRMNSQTQDASLVPSGFETAPHSGTVSNGSIPPDNEAFETTVLDNDSYSHSPFSSAPSGISRSPVEQLKNFLPPDQQARFEQAAFLMQTLQQLT